MKTIVVTAAAVSLGIMFAAAGSASAQTRAPSKPAPSTSTQMKIAPSPIANNGVRDNTAHAWTAGCYAEFGPNAAHPDPALLEKCLNW